jgi:hypothetical protein
LYAAILCYTTNNKQALFKYYDVHGDAVLACRLQHVSPTFRDYVTEQLQLYKNTTAPTGSSTAATTAATNDAAANRRTALMSRLALEGSNRSNGDMPTATTTPSPYKLAQQLNDPSLQYRQSEVVSSFSGSSSNLTAAAVAAHTAASAASATTGVSEPSQLSDIRSRLQRYQKPLAHIDGNTTAAVGTVAQHQATAVAAAAPKQQQQQAQISSTAATLKERLAKLTKAKTVL